MLSCFASLLGLGDKKGFLRFGQRLKSAKTRTSPRKTGLTNRGQEVDELRLDQVRQEVDKVRLDQVRLKWEWIK